MQPEAPYIFQLLVSILPDVGSSLPRYGGATGTSWDCSSGDSLSTKWTCSHVEKTSLSCQVLMTGIKSFCEHVLEIQTCVICLVSLNRLVCDDYGKSQKNFWRCKGASIPFERVFAESVGLLRAQAGVTSRAESCLLCY